MKRKKYRLSANVMSVIGLIEFEVDAGSEEEAIRKLSEGEGQCVKESVLVTEVDHPTVIDVQELAEVTL